MDIFILYLFTRLDAIAFAFGLCTFIALLISLAFLMEEKPARAKKAFIVAVGMLFLTVLTPTSKDVAIIIAGHYAYEGVTSEQFTGTAKKVFDLVNRELDEALAEPTNQ